ncbi:MarR family winged helix-turn-helix transcriptional regulator [Bacillus massiliigorillae]|uniref:MarR family winged helix-turn-helix transcriptional regulator n=1 Tax=Bacillus massiliigorillae TaxID=1243664 RepID=UPI0003A9BA3D|nr:MarR family transcriptional regulator [Bacillus massiliigorillae]
MHECSEESVGRWISLLNRYSSNYMSEQLKEYNIGAGQYQFLAALYQNEGLSQDDLACLLKMDKGTTARAICKLEESGYIERKTFSVNKRVKKIYLTEKAHTFEPILKSILMSWTQILTKNLTCEEQRMALQLLSKMAKNSESHFEKES